MKPTAVLVHGAFADPSLWAGVTEALLLDGVEAVAPTTPLHRLVSDATQLAAQVATIDGPVVLVGHAYGGAVAALAAARCANVVALVHVAGLVLAAGESAVDVMRAYPDTLLADALLPTVVAQAIVLTVRPDRFRAVVAADLPGSLADTAAAAQRPIAAAALEDPMPGPAGGRALPVRYVVATADRTLHLDAQRHMALRAGADLVEIGASHLVARSRPAEVAAVIAAAARPA